MKTNLFNIMSCSISMIIIFLLLGLNFHKRSDLALLDRPTLSHNPPMKKTIKNNKPPAENNKIRLKPLILPPPPLKFIKESQSHQVAETLPNRPIMPKRTVAKKIKNRLKTLQTKKIPKKIFLIKPIKPTPLDQKIKLIGTKILSKRNQIKVDQMKTKARGVFLKTKLHHIDHLNQMKSPKQKIKTGKKLTIKKSPRMDAAQTRKILKNGRAILRILEHGTGPSINFAWPDNAKERDNLFVLLRKCYGMQTVLLGQNKRLYRQSDASGRSWLIDMDRISGFIRMAGGKLTDLEKKIIKQTRQQHSQIQLNTAVRMFPRKFDGGLLGEIARIIDTKNTKIHSISARYKQNNRDLSMVDIRINGKIKAGRIDLSPYSTCSNSRARI